MFEMVGCHFLTLPSVIGWLALRFRPAPVAMPLDQVPQALEAAARPHTIITPTGDCLGVTHLPHSREALCLEASCCCLAQEPKPSELLLLATGLAFGGCWAPLWPQLHLPHPACSFVSRQELLSPRLVHYYGCCSPTIGGGRLAAPSCRVG